RGFASPPASARSRSLSPSGERRSRRGSCRPIRRRGACSWATHSVLRARSRRKTRRRRRSSSLAAATEPSCLRILLHSPLILRALILLRPLVLPPFGLAGLVARERVGVLAKLR